MERSNGRNWWGSMMVVAVSKAVRMIHKPVAISSLDTNRTKSYWNLWPSAKRGEARNARAHLWAFARLARVWTNKFYSPLRYARTTTRDTNYFKQHVVKKWHFGCFNALLNSLWNTVESKDRLAFVINVCSSIPFFPSFVSKIFKKLWFFVYFRRE